MRSYLAEWARCSLCVRHAMLQKSPIKPEVLKLKRDGRSALAGLRDAISPGLDTGVYEELYGGSVWAKFRRGFCRFFRGASPWTRSLWAVRYAHARNESMVFLRCPLDPGGFSTDIRTREGIVRSVGMFHETRGFLDYNLLRSRGISGICKHDHLEESNYEVLL